MDDSSLIFEKYISFYWNWRYKTSGVNNFLKNYSKNFYICLFQKLRSMKTALFLLIAFNLLLLSQYSSGQTTGKSQITGSWAGKINAGGVELRVIFNLSIVGKDSLVATLDSPDQGAKGIKLGPVTLNGKVLKISAGALMAEYNGTVISDTQINGVWTQGGNSFDLDLVKQKPTSTLNRPVETSSLFPYSYVSEVYNTR